jgi:glycosyltransferase involved in cell wall biosynthesis
VTLWYLPLERLEERYTAQQYFWMLNAIEAAGLRCAVLPDRPLSRETEGHQFLPWASRCHVALEQSAHLVKAFHSGGVKDGDAILFADLWHPGLEAAAYLRDLLPRPVRLYAIHYAGPFDPHDQTASLGYWGGYQEAAWLHALDGVFVGSQAHYTLIARGLAALAVRDRERLLTKVHITGLPFDSSDVRALAASETFAGGADRRTLAPPRLTVLWPHRLAPEKDPEAFYTLARRLAPEFPKVRWLVTSSRQGQRAILPAPVEFESVSKAAYYATLASAAVMVSTAYQETFGYTIHEAAALGTPVLCPRRACYPERLADPVHLYDTADELADKVRQALRGELPPAEVRPFGGQAQMAKIIARECSP